jgi:hypothetical protein
MALGLRRRLSGVDVGVDTGRRRAAIIAEVVKAVCSKMFFASPRLIPENPFPWRVGLAPYLQGHLGNAMELDVEALVRDWKQKMDRFEDQRQSDLLEYQRQQAERRVERTRLREGRYRRQVSEIADILSGKSVNGIIAWLRHDKWTVNEGLVLLCAYQPENVQFDENGTASTEDCSKCKTGYERLQKSVRRLDGLVLYDPTTIEVLGEESIRAENRHFLRLHADLLKVWRSGAHVEDRYYPDYFVQWALGKGYFIAWLKYARSVGYFVEPDPEEKPFGMTERNTLLVMIAALCKKLGIDPQDKSSAKKLERLVDALELRKGVTDETAKKHLDAIPEALRPRTK